MMRKLNIHRSFTLAAALLIASAVGLSGCVEQLDEIDRTQANVLKKADFHGVWYRLGVITDVPRNAGIGFVGQTNFGGDGGKILFDIREDYLVLYPVSEKVKDGDVKWHRKKIRNYWDKGHQKEFIEVLVGNPVAMFPIEKHFDIIRDYSTATGAQTNVLVENDTDRPWYEREHMRVNWMGNTLLEVFFNFGKWSSGSMHITGVDHYVQEHEKDDPNRFYMEWPRDDDGKKAEGKAANYFHWTSRLYAQPATTGSCSTYSLGFGDCTASVFDVRFSFRRADTKVINDFEVRDYHNEPDADKFGFFLSDRYTFDEEYGLTYTGHDYKAQIWNLWQKSKKFTPAADKDGKTQKCLTNNDCAKPTVCDQEDWFKEGVCSLGESIDYRSRGIRPIIYHLSADHPQEKTTLSAIYQVADNWSDVFQETVSWLYFWEDKWKNDGLPGFSGPGALFGQRFCSAHKDCSSHDGVLASLDAVVKVGSNTLAVGTKKGVTIAVDDLASRGKVDGGAYIMFVNASPDAGKATLTVGSMTIPDVEFKAGKIDAHSQSGLLAKGDVTDRMTVKVTTAAGTVEMANAIVRKNRIHWVVFYGGDRIAITETQLTKEGVRAFHAVANDAKTTSATGSYSDGAPLEIGFNGIREKGAVQYGRFTEYVHHTDNTVHAVFLKVGSRGDVSCRQLDGVGVCVGWKQELTEADRAARVTVKDSLPAAFLLCTNKYTGLDTPEACGTATERAKRLDDCRYWTQEGTEWINPCKAYVPNPGGLKMIGDARYNFIYWITNPHNSSPLGYGPSAADPDTGMLFWGSAYIYGAALTTYGQYGKDIVDLLNGDLDVDKLITGEYIKSYLKAKLQAGKDATEFGAAKWGDGHDHGQGPNPNRLPADYYSNEKAKKRATKSGNELVMGTSSKLSEEQIGKLSNAMATDNGGMLPANIAALADPKKLAEKFMNDEPTFDLNEVKARWDKLRGTSIERALINDEMALALSDGEVQPGDAISPEMMAKISPAGWASPAAGMDERRRMQFLGAHNIFPAEFADPSLVAMAKRLKCDAGEEPITIPADSVGDKQCYKGPALRLALQNAIYRGVLEHEIGHTVGLRHNFGGSADVLNYFDPYYDIREKEAVYCKTFKSEFGDLLADEICEKNLGERCADLKCSADADCPEGLACGTDVCVDKEGDKIGQCEGTVETYFHCADTDGKAKCAAAKGTCTPTGGCGTAVGCSTAEDCESGELCAQGSCVDQITAIPRTTPLVHQAKQPMRKYMPRPAPTQSEIDQRRTEYQYSTIMDYGQKINADFHGLGKYDKAAIKFGYGRLTEVFSDVSYMRNQLDKFAKNTSYTPQGLAGYMGTDGWRYAGSLTHPFFYLNNWMTPEYLNKRDSVPTYLAAAEDDFAHKYGRSNYDKTYFEVPYRYCSDEYRGGSLACYYFDTGAHMQEIVYHSAEQLKEYYIFDAFKRERMWFGWYGSPNSYMARVSDRYLLPIMAAARYYAVYNNILRIYPYFPYYDNHPMRMRGLKEASERAFRELTNILASPAPGSYKFDKDRNEYVNFDFKDGMPGSEIDIPIGVGKLPWTTFANDNGYYYAQHPMWIGALWDKLAAINAMVNSSASFLTDFVGEQLPLFRGTAIGFNTLYPKELSEVLGGIAAGSIEQIGGYVNTAKDGKLVFEPRNPFEPVNPTKPRVAPSINNLTIRLWAATQAIVNLPAGFDSSYTDGMAVWLKGSGGSYKFGTSGLVSCGNTPGASVVCIEEYEDPFGKKTYVAPRVNYNQDFFSPTWHVVHKLNGLKQQWQAAAGAEKQRIRGEMEKETEILDYFRRLYTIYGSIGA